MRLITRTVTMSAALLGFAQVAMAGGDKQGQQGSMQGEEIEVVVEEVPQDMEVGQVFFSFDSAKLGTNILPLANELMCEPDQKVILDAHTDAAGSPDYNAGLAVRRAEAVRDELVALGIDRDRIVLGIWGEEGEEFQSPELARNVTITSTDKSLAEIVGEREDTAVAVLYTEPEAAGEAVATP